jgi:hypothetical protein
MKPEELGRESYNGLSRIGHVIFPWEMLQDSVRESHIASALAVAEAVKREDADICLAQASVEGIAQSCADAILDTIPEGK